MSDEDFEKLKTDEALAYENFRAQDEISKELASKWVRLKQATDREILRREIKSEMNEPLDDSGDVAGPAPDKFP